MKSCSYAGCKPCHDEGYEAIHIDRLLKYLSEKKEPTGTFIDVGAHTGLWTLAVNDWYKKNGIDVLSYAIEADVENHQILSQNIDMEAKEVIVVNGAIWKERVVLGWNRCSHPARRRAIPTNASIVADYYVQADVLDAIILHGTKAELQVDAVKIDIEGAELQALQGAKLLLLKQSPLVLIEVSSKHYKDYGYDKEELYNNLTLLGYDFYEEVDKTNFEIEDESSIQLVFFSKGSKIDE